MRSSRFIQTSSRPRYPERAEQRSTAVGTTASGRNDPSPPGKGAHRRGAGAPGRRLRRSPWGVQVRYNAASWMRTTRPHGCASLVALVPLKNLTRGQVSVARVLQAWYIVARSEELADKPLAVMVWTSRWCSFAGERAARDAARPLSPPQRPALRGLPPGLRAGVRLSRLALRRRAAVASSRRGCPMRPRAAPGRFLPSRRASRTASSGCTPRPSRPRRRAHRFTMMSAPGYDHVASMVTAESTLHAATENASMSRTRPSSTRACFAATAGD